MPLWQPVHCRRWLLTGAHGFGLCPALNGGRRLILCAHYGMGSACRKGAMVRDAGKLQPAAADDDQAARKLLAKVRSRKVAA